MFNCFFQKEYNVGDIISDMHYGLSLPNNLKIISHIRLSCKNSSAKLMAFTNRHPSNKFLVIVGENGLNMVAVYSYDNTMFGMVELQYVES